MELWLILVKHQLSGLSVAILSPLCLVSGASMILSQPFNSRNPDYMSGWAVSIMHNYVTVTDQEVLFDLMGPLYVACLNEIGK